MALDLPAKQCAGLMCSRDRDSSFPPRKVSLTGKAAVLKTADAMKIAFGIRVPDLPPYIRTVDKYLNL